MNPLKTRRKELKLTQLEIANRIGVTKQMVGQYENDLKQPSIDKLLIIMRAYEMDERQLLDYIKYCGQRESDKNE